MKKILLIFLAFLVNYEVSATNKFKPEDFGIPLEQITSGPGHIWVGSGHTTVNPY